MTRSQRQLAVLVPLLLVITASELALNRLAVPALRMPAARNLSVPPPLWHQALDYSALFLQYFASALAIAVILVQVRGLWRDRDTYAAVLRYPLAFLGACFATLAGAAVVTAPGETLTFWFESSFTVLLVCIALSQIQRGGSLAAKLGVVHLILPLALHYYGPLASRTAAGREALWLGLPDRVLEAGQWSIVFIALITPYLFAPKPAARALAKPFPAIAALAIAGASSLLLSTNYEVALIVASRGLGFELAPGAPFSLLALYVVALASIAWTTMACLVAPSPERRRIGLGLGLVIAGGYSFAWPLHYLVSMVGLFTIADAARRVRADEGRARTSAFPAQTAALEPERIP